MLQGMRKSPYFELGREWQNGTGLDLEYKHDASQTGSWVWTHNHALSASVSRVQYTVISPLVYMILTPQWSMQINSGIQYPKDLFRNNDDRYRRRRRGYHDFDDPDARPRSRSPSRRRDPPRQRKVKYFIKLPSTKTFKMSFLSILF